MEFVYEGTAGEITIYNHEMLDTYTEVDPSGCIFVSGTQVWAIDSEGATSAGIYKDFGTGYLGNFVHKFAIKKIVRSGSTGIWGITNSPRYTYQDMMNNQIGISMSWSNISNSLVLYNHISGGVGNPGWYTVIPPYNNYADDTWYYVTITRNIPSVTVQVYTDADRTSLYGVSTMTCADATFGRLLTYHTYDNPTIGHDILNTMQYKDFDIDGPTFDFKTESISSAFVIAKAVDENQEIKLIKIISDFIEPPLKYISKF